MDSEAENRKNQLERIAELERALGQKQMEIDYLHKIIESASNEFGVDLKKNSAQNAWSPSGNAKPATP